MAEEEKTGVTSERAGTESRFRKILLVIVAAFLTFAGPTYVVYVLLNILKIDYFISMGCGFVLFMIGMVLIWYLIRRKSIT
ncbi:MAG: hypothetical protein QHH24_03695 [Candidatus Bathyarchaeota archaeon]|jgi:hypothetical protein|nr:hypothetical protein [Candidatus Bathyarchaeota archaeon]